MKKTLNVGLIGYKFMGRAHTSAYQRVGMFFDPGMDVKMKALCGREEAWLKETAERFGWESYETDYKKLLARDDIDMVDITSPSNLHKEMAIAAAEAGKHIFCEKPLALSVADAREILAAVNKAGVKHQIGFNYRFCPAVALAKKMIDEGKLGEIYHFRGAFLQDYLIDPDYPKTWRLDKSVAGSGSHGDLGAHVIDTARYLVGDIARVMGMSKTFVKTRPVVERMTGLTGKAEADAPRAPIDVDDATLFLFEFENGALGTIEATRYATGHKNDMHFEINGSKGSIIFYFERMNELQYFSTSDEEGLQGFHLIQASEGIHPYWSAWWPAGHVIGYDHTFVHEIYEFVRAINEDKKALPGFEDGLECAKVLEAVDISAAEKRWVEISEM